MNKEMNCWTHMKLKDNLYSIAEHLGNHCYNIFVVIGEKTVGIFDSGMGFSDGLREYIEDYIVQGKPMNCYVTHGDIDHIGSAALFDECYMSYEDIPNLKYHLSVPRMLAEVSNFSGGNENFLKYVKENHVKVEQFREKVKDIRPGEVIDLGRVVFEVYALSWHTPGSIVFYNRNENYAFVGDGVLRTTSWGRCKDYMRCLKDYETFCDAVDEDVLLYSSHDNDIQGKNILQDLVEAFKEITKGERENDEDFHFALDFLPKELMDPDEYTFDMWIHKHGKAVVPYNANMLPKVNK